jgi:hypothetical protein
LVNGIELAIEVFESSGGGGVAIGELERARRARACGEENVGSGRTLSNSGSAVVAALGGVVVGSFGPAKKKMKKNFLCEQVAEG